jgi:hypothetical protein
MVRPTQAISIFLGGLVLFLFAYKWCPHPRNLINKSSIKISSDSFDGYTLITGIDYPLNSHNHISLVDKNAQEVHGWSVDFPTLYSQFDNEFNLWVLGIDKIPFPRRALKAGLLKKYDWQGQELWSFNDPLMHSDFTLTSEGNVAYLAFEILPEDQSNKIRREFPHLKENMLLGDRIVELDPQTKKEVWTWSLSRHHLIFDLLKKRHVEYMFHDPKDSVEMAHANSIQYVAKNPFTQTPAYLISLRNLRTILLIEKDSKKVLWQSASNQFGTSHDATLLENGEVLFFDNGNHLTNKSLSSYLRQINVRNNQEDILWPLPGMPGAQFFFSPILSGVQKLPNENLLVTEGTRGHIFELTPKGEIVWSYFPPRNDESFYGPLKAVRYIYKTRRYNSPKIDKKISSSTRLKCQTCYYLNSFWDSLNL